MSTQRFLLSLEMYKSISLNTYYRVQVLISVYYTHTISEHSQIKTLQGKCKIQVYLLTFPGFENRPRYFHHYFQAGVCACLYNIGIYSVCLREQTDSQQVKLN